MNRELSLDEVAARLRVSRRTLKRRIAETGLAFARPGRTVVFTESDYQRLLKALRECRSNLSHQAREKEISSTSSEARSTDDSMRSLRRRQTQRLLATSRKTSNASSSRVVHLDLEKP